MNWPNKFWIEGFDGRIFLTQSEWETYLREYPVRYTNRRLLLGSQCLICNQIKDAPLQLAHKIPFMSGVRYLALTPDFLNSENNLITTHKGSCNNKAELDIVGSIILLRNCGVVSLPKFLPQNILDIWNATP